MQFQLRGHGLKTMENLLVRRDRSKAESNSGQAWYRLWVQRSYPCFGCHKTLGSSFEGMTTVSSVTCAIFSWESGQRRHNSSADTAYVVGISSSSTHQLFANNSCPHALIDEVAFHTRLLCVCVCVRILLNYTQTESVHNNYHDGAACCGSQCMYGEV